MGIVTSPAEYSDTVLCVGNEKENMILCLYKMQVLVKVSLVEGHLWRAEGWGPEVTEGLPAP